MNNALLEELVGKAVLIRTVTVYHVGNLDAIDDTTIQLSRASWVADTGRFNVAIATGKLNEVECFTDPVLVSRGAIVDITVWNHPLPTTSK